MSKRSMARRLSAVLLGGVVAVLLSSSPALRAGAAAGPTLTIAPAATGLLDGQYVKVVMSGFPPSSQVGGFGFRECIAKPKIVATDCTSNFNVSGIADDNGNGSTYLPVYAGNDPGLKSANLVTSIVCDYTHPCTMAAFLDAKSIDLSRAILAPISFARTPDACPAGQNGVLGSGSAVAYRAIYGWQTEVCLEPHKLAVDYTVHNSHDGWTQFQNGQTDFGVTGPYPAPTPDGSAKPPTYKYAPVSASGLVLAYRIYARGGAQITSLTLTPDQIAQIFAGTLYNLDRDPSVNALNPDVKKAGGFPGILHPYVRAEFSSETYAFTNWLARVAPNAWRYYSYSANGGKGGWVALIPSDVYPSAPLDTSNYKTGARAVALAVVDTTTPWEREGNIGFMDSSTAAFYGLPTVNIKLTDGVVAATTATIARALATATVNADGTVTPAPTLRADTWPIVLPAYLLAPTNTITPDKGATLASFLKYAVQEGQKTLPAGYAPLPANLVNQSLAVARLIPGGAPAPSPTPTPSPSPSPTPTPRPTPHPTPTPAPPPSFSVAPLPLLPDSSGSGSSGSPGSGAESTTSPSPGAAAAAAVTTPKANQHPAAVPLGQGAQLVAVIQNQDSAGARYLVPALAMIGLLSLLGGAVAQALARRRRS